MHISHVIPQLRTTNLAESIDFYTTKLGFTLDFQYEDFYAGIRTGNQIVHLKLVDEPDPSVDFVTSGEHFHLYFQIDDASSAADSLLRQGVSLTEDVHETTWGTKEFTVRDNQGHTLYFGQAR